MVTKKDMYILSIDDFELLCVDDFFGEIRNYEISPTDIVIECQPTCAVTRIIEMDKVVLGVNKDEEDNEESLHRAISLAIHNAIVEMIKELSSLVKREPIQGGPIIKSGFYLKSQRGYVIGLDHLVKKWDAKFTVKVLANEPKYNG